MSFSLTPYFWCYWSNGKGKEAAISSGSSSDSMKLCSSKKKKETKLSSSSSRKVKRKWQSREERKSKLDKEYDVVLVPSDGVCFSGSEESSYDSDWSIGWMEPHAPDFFQSDDEDADNSFAVLVPCYRNHCSDQCLNVVTCFPNGFPAEGNKYMDQWLASLQNF